jgi:hypothetical protein
LDENIEEWEAGAREPEDEEEYNYQQKKSKHND